METPEGQAILAHLRGLLGKNGEGITEHFSEVEPANLSRAKFDKQEARYFYVLACGRIWLPIPVNREQKYADFSQQCVELMLAGKYDRDNRYSWSVPGGDFRCGSVLGAMAYAYDMSYDGWDEAFRQKIALELQNFDKVTAAAKDGHAKKVKAGKAKPDSTPKATSVMDLSGRTGYPPGSNHYGPLMRWHWYCDDCDCRRPWSK